MEIISHRGYWTSLSEKNTRNAFDRSFSLGFGTETDVRDRNQELVIAHDMASEFDITFDEFCRIYKKNSCEKTLALNIKSDGLAVQLKKALTTHDIKNYFLFDMSVPDLRSSLTHGLNCYSRISEVETEASFYDSCIGIWMDGFYSDWYKPTDIYNFLKDGKSVCLVSSELHKRDYNQLWNLLRFSKLHLESELILCTDMPEEAFTFFFGGIK